MLGKKIGDLLDFVKTKHNVHGEIKRMVSTIRTCYGQFVDIEERFEERPESSAADTQATPGLRVNGVETFKKRKPAEPAVGKKEKRRVKRDRKATGQQSATPPVAAPSTSAATPSGGVAKEEEWQVAGKRRSRLPKSRASRPELVIVKMKEGGPSYAEILRQIKSDPSLKEVGERVNKVRRNAGTQQVC